MRLEIEKTVSGLFRATSPDHVGIHTVGKTPEQAISYARQQAADMGLNTKPPEPPEA